MVREVINSLTKAREKERKFLVDPLYFCEQDMRLRKLLSPMITTFLKIKDRSA